MQWQRCQNKCPKYHERGEEFNRYLFYKRNGKLTPAKQCLDCRMQGALRDRVASVQRDKALGETTLSAEEIHEALRDTNQSLNERIQRFESDGIKPVQDDVHRSKDLNDQNLLVRSRRVLFANSGQSNCH